MAGNTTLTNDNWAGVDLSKIPSDKWSVAKSLSSFPVTHPLPEQSATDAYEAVLAGAGALLPRRDAVDARVVEETRTGTATGTGSYNKAGIIDNPSAVGGLPSYATAEAPSDTDHDGMPDAWEISRGLNPNDPEDRNGDITGDGYTNLEKYLNAAASVLASAKELETGLRIYPVPTSENLMIETGSRATVKASIEVLNVNGKKVLQANLSPTFETGYTLEVSTLPPGLYLVTILIGSKLYHQRMVKK
ncbi:MAG: T9SS type A sorting domain-containing protein [Rufibacter sp.]